MSSELMNKIIQYLMGRPYKEVYVLMDEVRREVERMNKEEVDSGDNNEVDLRDE